MARFRTPRRPPPPPRRTNPPLPLLWDPAADPSIRLAKDENGKLIALRNGQRLPATIAASANATGAGCSVTSGPNNCTTANAGPGNDDNRAYAGATLQPQQEPHAVLVGSQSHLASVPEGIEIDSILATAAKEGSGQPRQQPAVVGTPRTHRIQSSENRQRMQLNSLNRPHTSLRVLTTPFLDGADDADDTDHFGGGEKHETELAPRTPPSPKLGEYPSSLRKRRRDEEEREIPKLNTAEQNSEGAARDVGGMPTRQVGARAERDNIATAPDSLGNAGRSSGMNPTHPWQHRLGPAPLRTQDGDVRMSDQNENRQSTTPSQPQAPLPSQPRIAGAGRFPVAAIQERDRQRRRLQSPWRPGPSRAGETLNVPAAHAVMDSRAPAIPGWSFEPDDRNWAASGQTGLPALDESRRPRMLLGPDMTPFGGHSPMQPLRLLGPGLAPPRGPSYFRPGRLLGPGLAPSRGPSAFQAGQHPLGVNVINQSARRQVEMMGAANARVLDNVGPSARGFALGTNTRVVNHGAAFTPSLQDPRASSGAAHPHLTTPIHAPNVTMPHRHYNTEAMNAELRHIEVEMLDARNDDKSHSYESETHNISPDERMGDISQPTARPVPFRPAIINDPYDSDDADGWYYDPVRLIAMQKQLLEHRAMLEIIGNDESAPVVLSSADADHAKMDPDRARRRKVIKKAIKWQKAYEAGAHRSHGLSAVLRESTWKVMEIQEALEAEKQELEQKIAAIKKREEEEKENA